MIKLYDFLPCPFGQKIRIILAEKGLSYELIQIDLTQGEQRKPDFLRLNPFGRVPVLIDEDITVYDSTIIAEYLEDEYPEPPLLPAIGSSALRARARTWEDFAGYRDAIAAKLHDYTGLPVDYILRADLRIDGGEFRQNLQADQSTTTGRLDTRFSGPDIDPLSQRAEYDPFVAALAMPDPLQIWRLAAAALLNRF